MTRKEIKEEGIKIISENIEGHVSYVDAADAYDRVVALLESQQKQVVSTEYKPFDLTEGTKQFINEHYKERRSYLLKLTLPYAVKKYIEWLEQQYAQSFNGVGEEKEQVIFESGVNQAMRFMNTRKGKYPDYKEWRKRTGHLRKSGKLFKAN